MIAETFFLLFFLFWLVMVIKSAKKQKKKVLNGIIATFFKVGEIVPWYLPIWFDVHIFDFRKNKSWRMRRSSINKMPTRKNTMLNGGLDTKEMDDLTLRNQLASLEEKLSEMDNKLEESMKKNEELEQKIEEEIALNEELREEIREKDEQIQDLSDRLAQYE